MPRVAEAISSAEDYYVFIKLVMGLVRGHDRGGGIRKVGSDPTFMRPEISTKPTKLKSDMSFGFDSTNLEF